MSQPVEEADVKRRSLLRVALSLPWFANFSLERTLAAAPPAPKPRVARRRTRPGDPRWPDARSWQALEAAVGGRLIIPRSPLRACDDPHSERCLAVLQSLKNPFYIGDEVALTQTSGWIDAWKSQPSAYAVAARNSADVAAAIAFARTHDLRLVVKGGGHSYQGTSQAADSLLIWTHPMNAITLHDDFVGEGCSATTGAQPAVTIEAGALWIEAYDAVTTRAGRYVQGGGCTTVGVAGLVQSGGFGSFSKRFGTAAAGLIEAEIVTADGQVRIANACQHTELYWAIKGGGGGSLGVITKLTLRTHDLPETFGGAFGVIAAHSDTAYRALIARFIDFYQSALFNPHWGEQIIFRGDNTLRLSMVFQGLSQRQAVGIWEPFIEWVKAADVYTFTEEINIATLPARHFWDAAFLKAHAASLVIGDPRPGTPENRMLWAGDAGQVGWLIHGYHSAWLSQALLDSNQQAALVDALYESSRHWALSLHVNKGLAGAPPDVIAAARDTATHPDLVDAFALAICAADGPPDYDGMPANRASLDTARVEAVAVAAAMRALKKIAPRSGAYVSESDYFQSDWQSAFWGDHYPRLASVKRTYDPDGLFFVRHGVGSEHWSEDGFTRL